MNTTDSHKLKEILITAITPYFLERDALWFKENFEEIRKKSIREAWWRDRTLFLETGSHLTLSPFLRKLADMGYVKVGQIENRGEFSARGGIVDVFPVNSEQPVKIEFFGNAVENIISLPVAGKQETPKIQAAKTATDYERMWLSGLKPEDYLVHIDHGIGIYRGLTRNATQINAENLRPSAPYLRQSAVEEFYVLEYAPARRGGRPDRLLIPRNQAKKLSRYIGFETPPIHRLGGTVWESTKRKAKEDAKKFAEELLAILKNRAGAARRPYALHYDIEQRLSHSFIFEETQDQKRAIAEVHQDLSREQPMDRLLLGDVGFGKTEVALRAAARVAYDGRQVALLSPTTILADQHSSTFHERLKGLPLKTAVLTRLTPKKDIKNIIAGIAKGEVDIVIGTHRLLSRDISFRDLGLTIIDEEQRFGVRHKEKFKQLRAEIDILSLSATPIPRTLSLAISKFRDLSLIQEPPVGRLPIKTFVLPFSKRIVAEAIAYEHKRKGQIFYLWNRIENIEAVRRELEKISPDISIAILHGRMPEQELIRAMHGFRSGATDLLLATTIIENGLDLPSANTLIVANAARLGLAQAYQIRGRIGRGDKPAYAYFLYPARSLTEKGRLRLRALQEAAGLGAGFQIALKDLEIRGAGNVLGRQQSGTMNKVGLNLYAQLLSEALEEFK